MLESLNIANLTVFSQVNCKFGNHLNIIVGENGSGKSHILKAAYCAIAVSANGAKSSGHDVPTKAFFATAIADKFRNVFKPDELGRLARRCQGQKVCELQYTFNSVKLPLEFSFGTRSKKEVVVKSLPTNWIEKHPIFLPTRELLSIFPGFVSLYETTHLPFEETWRDTCILLGAPLARGPRMQTIKQLLDPIEIAMGGKIELDTSGRFYLNLTTGKLEIHLVAEGLRKLATIARLIATGSLLDKGYLFWDEPESNLNPKLIKIVAKAILQLATNGIQVFIATHSLFLLRELHILKQQEFTQLDTRCFGLHIDTEDGVTIKQGATMDDIGDIAALDEDLQQAERYIDTEMGAYDRSSGQQAQFCV